MQPKSPGQMVVGGNSLSRKPMPFCYGICLYKCIYHTG
jgi:hypothetical protein